MPPVPAPWRFLLIGLAAVVLGGCGEPPTPAPQPGPKRIEVIRLQAPERVVQRSFPGHVRAAERVDLSFNVPGRIVELYATEGKRVEKGELLAKLDARDYESRLRAAVAEYEKAEANYERARKLLQGEYISKAEYDQLKAARDVAAAKVTTARKSVADTELRAPFSGVVAKRYVENFTEVRAKQPVLSLQDVENLEIVVDVPEQFVVRRHGRPQVELEARFDTLPGQTFPLTIKEYATEADPKTGTYPYVTALKAPEGVHILPGMTATVIARRTDTAATEGERFVLPIPAVFAEVTPEPRVWIVGPDNRVRSRPVKLGRLTGEADIEVLEGLRAGEVVVVQAAPRLREGMEIVPVTAQAKGDSDAS
jgi:RND family efflux transporter MFP subunit